MVKKLIIPFILVILVFFGIGVNNSLVEKEEKVNESWARVETQYQRRADLIPNLVNTVKAAANFEQETLTAVIDARSKATSIQVTPEMLNNEANLQKFQQAQTQLSGALSRLLVTVEKYPELKANQNFRDLSAELAGTENRITVARDRFNTSARSYNTSIRKFPASIFASIGGHSKKAYFQAEKGSQNAPTVDFN